MANPKRRHSKARRDIRRAPQRLQPPNVSTCPQCGTGRLPHRVCPTCGYYRGTPVVVVKTVEKKTAQAGA